MSAPTVATSRATRSTRSGSGCRVRKSSVARCTTCSVPTPGASLDRISRRRSQASPRSTKPRSTIATAASAPSTHDIRRTVTPPEPSSASYASSRTSRPARKPRTRAPGSLRSSTGPRTRSSPRASTASSRRGIGAPRKLFGYSAEEAVGQPVTMLIPEERRHEEEKILARIRNGEPVEPYETVRRRKDGSLLDISLAVSPIIDENGRIVGASKIARDITARKRAEEDVRRSREALNSLVDQAPFGIYIVDSELKLAQVNARSQAGAFFNVRPRHRPRPRGGHAHPVARAGRGRGHCRLPADTRDRRDAYRSRDFSSPRADTDNVESYEWELHRITLPDGRLGVVSLLLRLDSAAQSRACSARGGSAQGRVPRDARSRATQSARADSQRLADPALDGRSTLRPPRRSTRCSSAR